MPLCLLVAPNSHLSRKVGKTIRRGLILTPKGHSSFVIIAKEVVTRWTNATKFMDTPLKLKEEAEEAMGLHKIGKLTMSGLRLTNKNHHLRHTFQIYLA